MVTSDMKFTDTLGTISAVIEFWFGYYQHNKNDNLVRGPHLLSNGAFFQTRGFAKSAITLGLADQVREWVVVVIVVVVAS